MLIIRNKLAEEMVEADGIMTIHMHLDRCMDRKAIEGYSPKTGKCDSYAQASQWASAV